MKRRAFTQALIGGAAATLIAAPAARAQGGPVEGRHYRRLAPPVPVSSGPERFEVLEFFWYGCPHCAAFEPALDAWARAQPADVAFRRVPVAFRAEVYPAHQRLFYALESLGLVATMHLKVFRAIHEDRLRLASPAEISGFMAAHGVDAGAFMAAYGSFGTEARVRQANRLVEGYGLDGVPAMGVQGRFYTSGALAGDNDRMLAVTDFLLGRLRARPG